MRSKVCELVAGWLLMCRQWQQQQQCCLRSPEFVTSWHAHRGATEIDADGEPDRFFTIGFRSEVQDRVAQLAQHHDTASASTWKLCVVPTKKSTTVGSQPCSRVAGRPDARPTSVRVSESTCARTAINIAISARSET